MANIHKFCHKHQENHISIINILAGEGMMYGRSHQRNSMLVNGRLETEKEVKRNNEQRICPTYS
jgi:hypothetical protein